MDESFFQSKECSDYIIKLRRYFHKHPELSMEEVKTTNRIEQELKNLGIEYDRIRENCVIGRIGRGKKKIALRADIDALPILEKSDVPYRSVNDGVMHACGHDGHTAMLLGAAKYLKGKEKSLNGVVYLCFQPAEEISAGAVFIVDYLEKQGGVDTAFGLHLMANDTSGFFSSCAGPMMSANGRWTVRVLGKGGHGSRPDQCIDPVVIAARILIEFTTIPASVSPLEICSVVGPIFESPSNAINIIPSEATIKGSVRTFSVETRSAIFEKMERISTNIAAAYGATVEFSPMHGVPPVINDMEAFKRFKKVAASIVGKEKVKEISPYLGSEDFGQILEKYSGVFAFLGATDEEKGPCNLHMPEFYIDESVLLIGSHMYSRYAIDFLAE